MSNKSSVSSRSKANAIRALSMDAVQQANSGHPGAPMGMADIATALWCDHLQHNPADPTWWNRDRFILSNGHGSMLLYALLHLTGYDVSMDDLKDFRQLHSKTAGHPEFGYAPGIETTTGPLGQGLANAVGMALAERTLASQFNREQHNIVDHHTYAFVGDGCLMEGISHEACSLAGAMGLHKLIVLYDDNGISIDGQVAPWFDDDTPERFRAYGWQVIANVDGHDADMVNAAIAKAKGQDQCPTLICCHTEIGFGSPKKAGTAAAHGAPLGAEEIAATKAQLDWPHAAFEIPNEINQAWNARARGESLQQAWQEAFSAYASAYPELANELERRMGGQLPEDWDAYCAEVLQTCDAEAANVASRKASQMAIEKYAPRLPEMIGGSADLTGSNLTNWSGSLAVSDDPAGNYIYFGVREFAMVAMANGMALYGGFKPYVSTFLIFSEYARNAIRMAALMKQPAIFVFTHDSIGLGEDGPTHQPVEQLATLRLLPNLINWRPCDAVETMVAWQHALESKDSPHSLVFSRQTLPHQTRDAAQLAAISKGGYVLKEAASGSPKAIIIATGSEVELAMQAAESLSEQQIRVVSMPSVEVFNAQSAEYQDSVIPADMVKLISIEAGVTAGWRALVGRRGLTLGIDTFGESGPAAEVFAHFELTSADVNRKIADYLNS